MTVRLAIFSDVHGDLHALEDALRTIERLGSDLIVCAGDLVDYGLFPDETIALLRDRGIPTLRGNHDRWAIAKQPSAFGGGVELSDASRAFIMNLPTSWSATLQGVRVAVHHASPKSDMDGLLPDEMDLARAHACLDKAEADVLLVGHTHVACTLDVGNRLIANPGALLRTPAVAEEHLCTPGTFGVLVLPTMVFNVHDAKSGAIVSTTIRRRIG